MRTDGDNNGINNGTWTTNAIRATTTTTTRTEMMTTAMTTAAAAADTIAKTI